MTEERVMKVRVEEDGTVLIECDEKTKQELLELQSKNPDSVGIQCKVIPCAIVPISTLCE